MKGIQYTLAELIIMIIFSMLPMFGIVTGIQRSYPHDTRVLVGGIITGVLCAGTILLGCFLGLSWVVRQNAQTAWHRMYLLLLGGTLLPDIFGTLGCVIGFCVTLFKEDGRPVKLQEPTDVRSLIFIAGIGFVFLILLYLCWVQENKSQQEAVKNNQEAL